MSFVFSADDMRAMSRVKMAFDPDDLCNPGKILPEEFSRSVCQKD
jgi:FAD/FMN-containing dehydrogenase